MDVTQNTAYPMHVNSVAVRGGGWGGAYSFVELSRLTIDHASLSRRSTVSTPNGDISNIWALITLVPYITRKLFAYPIPVLFRRLR